MKKSVKIRAFSLILAAVLLGGALTVAAVMGSPYETLKKAVLNAAYYSNVTTETWATVTVNGEVCESQKSFTANGENSYLSYNFDENGDFNGYYYNSSALTINRDYVGMDGTQWYSAYVREHYDDYYHSSNILFSPFASEDRDSARMRFAELLVDALVGDLKNNFTMSSSGGIRNIQATLTESQIPELAKAGIDVLVEQSNSYYNWREYIANGEYIFEQISINGGIKTVTVYKQSGRLMSAEEQKAWDNGTYYDLYGNDYYEILWVDGACYVADSPRKMADSYTAPATREDYDKTDPLNMPMQSLTINYLSGEAEVDEQDNLVALDMYAKVTVISVLGDTNVVEFDVGVRFSEIGTSEVACPIPGATQLLTPDYMKANFGREYGNVYFTLNEDGSINIGSVTTTYPGESERKIIFD